MWENNRPQPRPVWGSHRLTDNGNPGLLPEVWTPPAMSAESAALAVTVSAAHLPLSPRGTWLPGPTRGNALAGLCENNIMLFFQSSWLRTRCPECSQVERSFLVPSSQRRKEQLPGSASNNNTRKGVQTLPGSLPLWQPGLEASEAREDGVVKICWPGHCVYFTEQVITVARFFKEKEKAKKAE